MFLALGKIVRKCARNGVFIPTHMAAGHAAGINTNWRLCSYARASSSTMRMRLRGMLKRFSSD